MKKHDFAGTSALIRFFLRRDRFLLPIWVLLPALTAWGQVSFVTTLPDWREFLAEMTANPVTAAWLGPVVPMSVAGAIIWRSTVQGAMILIIGSLLTVIRHTRTEETAGRSELIRGGAVGCHAILTAALALTCIANLVAGLLVTLAFIGVGLPVGGSLLLGLTLAAAGWFFAGLGALSAQLQQPAVGARGIALAVLGVTFVPMVLNNVGGGYTGWAWLSPMIWYRLTQPFADNNSWALLVLILLSVSLCAIAYSLSTRRDFGTGLWPQRPGPAEARPSLRTPLALAWRLQRGNLISWTVALIFLGGALGLIVPNISEDIGQMLTDIWPDRWVNMIATVGNREALMAVFIYILALLVGVTIFTIFTVLRLRKEEIENRAELLMSRPVSRIQWMGSYLVLVYAGSAFLLLALGMATGLGWGFAANDVGNILPLVLVMSLSKIPVVWVIGGVSALLYGLFPRISTYLILGLLALFVLLEMLWEAQIVDWSVMQLTPFAYAHYTIPISDLSLVSLFFLTCLAGAFTAIGLIGFRRRDIYFA